MRNLDVLAGLVVGLVVGLVACRGHGIDYVAPPLGTDGRVGLGSLDRQLDAALARRYERQVSERPAPFSLVPGDGSELALKALDASIVIHGPLAHTELRFTFHNAEPRQREGRFAISLPSGAAVGRFGMRVNDEWREARIVARERGRQVYETFLHRRVDPALLEQDLGDRFSARVFPIAPNEDKQLVIGYDHVVDEHRPYTLALAGLPAIPQVDIAIDRDGELSKRRLRDAAPVDVVVPIAGGSAAVAAGGAFVARVVVPDSSTPAAIPHVMIAVDTSASRATVMGRQVEAVRRVLAGLPADTDVALVAFDQGVSELYRGPASAAAGALRLVFEHGALGASDLGALLDRAAGSGLARLVIVGDGVATIGERDPKQLAAAVAALERVDGVQIGDGLDRDTLGAIVRAGKQPGAILDGRDPDRVAAQLQLALPAELPIRVAGASQIWPATTRGLAPGEPVWVSGLRDAVGGLAIAVGERTVHVAPTAGDARATRRAAARAELAVLTERYARAGDAERSALADQIEKLALAHGLVSAMTSLIVFDNDGDEQRMLGPRDALPPPRADAPAGELTEGELAKLGGPMTGGEAIMIAGKAPTIDATSTTQGITIDKNYLHNVPVPGRTYEAAIDVVAGTHRDRYGVSISGSTSLENVYIVDGINTTAVGPAGRRLHSLVGAMSNAGDGWAPTSYGTWSPSREPDPPPSVPAYTGPMRDVMTAIAKGDRDRAFAAATRWQLASPGEVAALLALGEALEARGASVLAARAYGSLADLFPNRAELLRGCAERLDRVANTLPAARTLAIDVYRRALRERPDHATTYRLLAYALLRAHQADAALDTVLAGIPHASPDVMAVLLADAHLIAAYIVAREPNKRAALRAKPYAIEPATTPSLHVVLSWETDANDVDLHVRDHKGGHAWYGERELRSGGELLRDLTDGYGPEMFTVDDPRAFPYSIAAHYFRKGPMGVGLGTVQVIRHDGHGNLTIDDRPFAIQNDNAMIELGQIR